MLTPGESSTRRLTDNSSACPTLNHPNALVSIRCQLLISPASCSEKKEFKGFNPSFPRQKLLLATLNREKDISAQRNLD